MIHAGTQSLAGGYRRAGVGVRLALGAAVLGTLLVVAALVSLSLGPVEIPVGRVAGIALALLGLDSAAFSQTERLIIQEIRLPRIVTGATVGMALGVAGAVMQGVFRNPMADPGIIGVSAGGALGAVLAITTGAAGLFFMALPASAFLGALAAMMLVYGVAAAGGRFSVATLLLAGVAVNAFLSAIISAIVILVPRTDVLREALFWLAGGLNSRAWEHVAVALPLTLAATVVALVLSRDLNLLLLGDDEARSLGVRVGVVRTALPVAASMATGAAVAVSGIVGFVGLVTPHMLRLVVGPDHRVLVPLSALGGALFVVVADMAARTVVQPAEFPLGVLTAFVGAPFFIVLLLKNKRHVHAL